MPTANQVKDQINSLLGYLIEAGLTNDEYAAFQRSKPGALVQVTFENDAHVSIALRNLPYGEIYRRLAEARAYNARMRDGALIQMMYEFSGSVLQRHRLAFFPAPHLADFQDNPDVYPEDASYNNLIAKSDVAKNTVPFPVRFDYDVQEGLHQELVHPKSHLTLGQYEDCRVPVTTPVTPFWFINFILRNFYHSTFKRHAHKLPAPGGSFAESIHPAERGVVHVVVPA